MKKIVPFVLILLTITLFVSCDATQKNSEALSTTSLTKNTMVVSEITSSVDSMIEKSEPKTEKSENKKGFGGAEITPGEYRDIYYSVDWYVSSLVGDEEEVLAWRSKNMNDVYEKGEMPVVTFIKDFNISKDDFEKAIEQAAQWVIKYGGVPTRSPKDYLNQMMYEVYNADIIYTFDNELINEYYLTPKFPFCYPEDYEYAVITGLYETKTTDFYYSGDQYCTQAMNAENADFEAIKEEAEKYMPSDPQAYILSTLQYYEENKITINDNP